MKIEDLRGSIRAFDFSPCFLKSREDVVPLYLIQGWESRFFGSDSMRFAYGARGLLVRFRAHYRNQVRTKAENRFGRNDCRTLNHILQFADVAGPRVVQ